MAYFVEYQRALRALRVAGIIVGIFLLLAVIARIWVHGQSADSYLGNLTASPTAHVTRETLADGSSRTVVDDPVKRVHAVAVRRGNDLRIDITEPSRGGRSENDNLFAGELQINQTVDRKRGMEHVVVHTTTQTGLPIGILFMSSIVLGLIVASLLGGVLAKENDGHLELAWTKPVSRERYALEAFAVDVLTIIASQILWVVTVILCILLFLAPHVEFGPQTGLQVLISLLGPIGWYAALTAWSASLKRGPGLVIGLGWLVAALIPGLAGLTANSSIPLVVVIHAVLMGLTYLDPLAYFSFHSSGVHVSGTVSGALQLAMPLACAALAGLIIFYLAVAVAQWRRVEA